ncbi:MAG: TetR/AcrR family transcriptional regulator [Solirubrobacterales bacterium]|nr:TetR/AcrR family transcriptional regulator [Solirubrobacterales bacterium]
MKAQDKKLARGRPRDPSRDAVILEAALELLKDVGYDRLSVGSIAARAGVSKATIYRRWANKAALVASAVEQRGGGAPPDTRGAGLRGALLTVLSWLAQAIAGQEVGLLAAVIAGMRSDPELAAAMRTRLRRDQEAMAEATLSQAVEQGETLAPDAARLFSEIAPAMVVHRLIFVGEPYDPAFLEHMVDDVLLPLLRGPAT